MKRYLTGTLLFFLGLGLALPAFAKTSLYDLERQQMRRIHHGTHSGQLTRKEAKVLRREQRDIRSLKRRFVRDGRVSRNERRVLRKRYARADRRIYRYKHNRHTRYTRRYNGDHTVLGFSFARRF